MSKVANYGLIILIEAYRDQVSLYQGYGAEGISEALVCCDGGKNS